MAGLPVIIQFVRNLFCVLKTLIASDNVFHKSIFPNAPGFISKMSYFQGIIMITQLMALYFNISSGVKNIFHGFKLKFISRLVNYFYRYFKYRSINHFFIAHGRKKYIRDI
jgi:hypothetical protein